MSKYLLVLLLLLTACRSVHADASAQAPSEGRIKVAFALSANANVMDIAGPWEVFQDTMLEDGKGRPGFALYTVAASTAPVRTTGSGGPGMTITPDYRFEDAPLPDIVVVGAQAGGPALRAWLQRVHAQGKIILSICTSAFELARAGLLSGKQATTHHWYFGSFAEEFPDVRLVREVRYVQAAPLIYTAGGLTSGVDLSLHIVARYFGAQQAQATADYMEYAGEGWKSNAGIAALKAPVTHQRWRGDLAPGTEILLNVKTVGASSSVTADLPARKLAGLPAKVKSDGRSVHISLPIRGQLATFAGEVAAHGGAITGSYTEAGLSSPLTLSLQKE